MLPSPNLDDRSFEELLRDAKARAAEVCPSWTDFTPHDPGVVLLELFAHVTETMLYRLNRLPDKVYIELLRLIGVNCAPPRAAATRLVFSLPEPAEKPIVIPRATAVGSAKAAQGAVAPVFLTDDSVSIAAGASSVEVAAYHGEFVEAERLGAGSGRPGLSFNVAKPPIVAAYGGGLDLVVGVEALDGELDDRAPARSHAGKNYRLWREVEDFSASDPDDHVYLVDRNSGRISFGPGLEGAALAAVPPSGREVVVWYLRGGGAAGNLPAGTLQALKGRLAESTLRVKQPEAASGGRDAEPLSQALARGPHEMRSLRRAVTARDYERLSLRASPDVARARAVTQAALWKHGRPGTVEVLLVPNVPPDQRGASHENLSSELLARHQLEAARQRIAAELELRRPLATSCTISWTRYKRVAVKAKVVVHEGEDQAAISARLRARLHASITPLDSELRDGGWPFGRALRASDVYQILLGDRGVKYVEEVRFHLGEVPGQVTCLAKDAFESNTWYAGSGPSLFRSMDDGEGWEAVGTFAGELVQRVAVHAEQPGLLAVASRIDASQGSFRLRVSLDCGESWFERTHALDQVHDIAWITSEGRLRLLIASELGLYQWELAPDTVPLRLVVDEARQQLGFCAVATAATPEGDIVSVACTTGGVYLSAEGGKPKSFQPIGLQQQDVRVLEIQRLGPRAALWAGVFSAGDSKGTGVLRWELHGATPPPDGFVPYARNWDGGSAYSIAFAGAHVFVGTYRRGVLALDASRKDAAWAQSDINSGLALHESTGNLFLPVPALAATDRGLVFAGGKAGVFQSMDGQRYTPCSRDLFTDKVTLPSTWLFCSGEHEVQAVVEHAR